MYPYILTITNQESQQVARRLPTRTVLGVMREQTHVVRGSARGASASSWVWQSASVLSRTFVRCAVWNTTECVVRRGVCVAAPSWSSGPTWCRVGRVTCTRGTATPNTSVYKLTWTIPFLAWMISSPSRILEMLCSGWRLTGTTLSR